MQCNFRMHLLATRVGHWTGEGTRVCCNFLTLDCGTAMCSKLVLLSVRMGRRALTGMQLTSVSGVLTQVVLSTAIDDMTADLKANPLNQTHTKIKFVPVFLPMARLTNSSQPRCAEDLVATGTCPIDAPLTVTYRVATF